MSIGYQQSELRKMLDELLDVDSGLTEKEINFLDNLKSNWEGNFTDRQSAWLVRIHNRIFGEI